MLYVGIDLDRSAGMLQNSLKKFLAALLTAMRIVLRRIFWQAHGRTNYLTKHFRLALDIGNTNYREGSQRETLVSDIMLSRCPPGFRQYFVPCGSFGGKQIWRMRPVKNARNPE